MAITSLPHTCIAIAVLIGVGSAMANAQGGPKLYRWVGADGKAHYSDQIPPEAIDKARQELSKNGITVGQVDRALTAEERAALAAKAAADAQTTQAQEDVKKNDQVLLGSYPTEAELKRSYDERGVVQVNTIKATRISIESQQQSLASQLIQASTLELNGKPIYAKLADSIQFMRKQLLDLQTLLVQRTAENATLQSEFKTTLQHYRELQAAAAARAAATPAGTPPNG